MNESPVSRAHGLLTRRLIAVLSVALLSSCASPTQQFAKRVERAGLTTVAIKGTEFTHQIYRRPQQSTAAFTLVFIEGDSGWSDDLPVYVYNPEQHTAGIVYSREPAADPTPAHPLALELMLGTSQPAWYLTRPCYNGMHDPACVARMWTSERYSKTVVESMASALTSYAATQSTTKLILVGYSGGGTLAVLLAERMPSVVGVISIAANLDTQAWANALHYEPLLGSLNPAADAANFVKPHVILVGDQDKQVPFATLARFLDAHPQTRVLHYASYDHVCCWENNWPRLLEEAEQQLDLR